MYKDLLARSLSTSKKAFLPIMGEEGVVGNSWGIWAKIDGFGQNKKRKMSHVESELGVKESGLKNKSNSGTKYRWFSAII
jgi:hypothetical protein